VTQIEPQFVVRLASGETLAARLILLTTCVSDDVPLIPLRARSTRSNMVAKRPLTQGGFGRGWSSTNDRFDIHRNIGQHLTFGYGAHYCLGAALARLEGRIALDEVLNRFPNWEIDLEHARRAPTSTVRGWDSMPAIVG